MAFRHGSTATFDADDPDALSTLKETAEVECKLASGRDGRGHLPDDVWSTYSAFANTRGGVILLGIMEGRESFEVVGVRHADRLKTMLFDQLNNPQKGSHNVVSDEDARTIPTAGRNTLPRPTAMNSQPKD